MGSIIGGLIGGVGSLLGGSSSDSQAKNAALTGYNYLNGNSTNQAAQTAGTAATGASADTQGTEAGLLTATPGSAASKTAFNNYLGSTGYNFQLDQGSRAITGNAASRGLLDSGGTAKALTSYGQNLGAQTFNNYLGQLNTLNTQQQGTVNSGLTATGQVGTAGTSGGSAAAGALTSGNATQTGSGIGNILGTAAGFFV